MLIQDACYVRKGTQMYRIKNAGDINKAANALSVSEQKILDAGKPNIKLEEGDLLVFQVDKQYDTLSLGEHLKASQGTQS